MSDTRNENLNRPIYVDGNLTINPSIIIGQTPYLLEKYDFDKIVNGKDYLTDLKTLFIGTSVGLFINMASKFMGHKMDSSIAFDKWEIFAFIISIVLMILSIIIDKCTSSERKKIVQTIKSHFNIK